MGLDNFNRIINVKLYKSGSGSLKDTASNILDAYIKCPTHGRKPNVGIQGKMLSSTVISSLEIKIRNLYLNGLNGKNYTKVEVEAGYQDSKKFAFSGDIYLIYQETPGPESVINITCLQGNARSFLNTYVSLNLKEGYSIKDALEQIADKLGYEVELNDVDKTDKASFIFDGTARDAIDTLKHRFPEVEIMIVEETIKCILKSSVDTSKVKAINYLSAPPQLVGDEDTKGLATITAPFDPTIKPNDLVSFPSTYFASKRISSSASDRTIMRVVNIQFQFATVSNINKMTLMGQLI